jgi:hypothetical protein
VSGVDVNHRGVAGLGDEPFGVPAARMYDSTAAVDGYMRPSLLTDLVMVGKALGSGSPTASMRTRRLHRRGNCAASDSPMKPPIECPIMTNESAP